MIEAYSEMRQRIHEKAHAYFFFKRICKAKRNQFFGATDALFDTNIDASDFSVGVLAAPKAGMLLCYGFLQALYVQQDAVQTLGDAFDLKWRAENDPELKRIRDVRNRLCGHPSKAGERDKSKKISSATISLHDISPAGFSGDIYFDDCFEKVQVDVQTFMKLNKERLLPQMMKIEAEMDKREKAFRDERSGERFASCVEGGFSYLVDRLHCILNNEDRRIQADCHADMMRDILLKLQDHLRSKGFADHADTLAFRVVFRGIDLLQGIIRSGNGSEEAQDHFDLIYSGLQRYIHDLIREISELDKKLGAPI